MVLMNKFCKNEKLIIRIYLFYMQILVYVFNSVRKLILLLQIESP